MLTFYLLLISAGGMTSIGPFTNHANCMAQAEILKENFTEILPLCIKVQ